MGAAEIFSHYNSRLRHIPSDEAAILQHRQFAFDSDIAPIMLIVEMGGFFDGRSYAHPGGLSPKFTGCQPPAKKKRTKINPNRVPFAGRFFQRVVRAQIG